MYKDLLTNSSCVKSVGSFAAAIAPNLTLLTWARVFQGAGAAAGMVVGRAMVQDLFDGGHFRKLSEAHSGHLS